MTIRCICVDDERLARKGLQIALESFPDFELISEHSSANEVLKNQPKNIDVLFVDIEMPNQSGFELLQRWQGPLPLIVFITAYDQYAVRAFEEQALDYLLKPIDIHRFSRVVERIRATKALKASQEKTDKLIELVEDMKVRDSLKEESISVKTTEGYFRIKLSDIYYMESVGDHVCVYHHDTQVITRQTLKNFTASLEDKGFRQIHRSFLLNTSHVEQLSKLKFGDCQVVLSNGETLRVSRRYRSNLQTILSN